MQHINWRHRVVRHLLCPDLCPMWRVWVCEGFLNQRFCMTGGDSYPKSRKFKKYFHNKTPSCKINSAGHPHHDSRKLVNASLTRRQIIDALRGVGNFWKMTRCRVTRQKYVGNSRHLLGGRSPLWHPPPPSPSLHPPPHPPFFLHPPPHSPHPTVTSHHYTHA